MQRKSDVFRVLVVDDDEIALEAIKAELGNGGFEVFALTTAIGASQLAIVQEIDVIVLDLNMPAIRGDRLARMFRSHPKLTSIPIVIVSACSHRELAAAAVGIAHVTLVPKSRVRTDLASVIWRLANQSREGSAELSLALTPSLAPPPMSLPGAGAGPLTALREKFLSELPNVAVEATRLVRSAVSGDAASQKQLRQILHRAKGDASLLGIPELLSVIVPLERLLQGIPFGGAMTMSAHRALLAGLNVIARAARANQLGKSFDAKPVLELLAALEAEAVSSERA